jgi:hypothetical protein
MHMDVVGCLSQPVDLYLRQTPFGGSDLLLFEPLPLR